MLYTTHVITSLLAGYGVAKTTGIGLSVYYYGGVMLGSVLPDIDHKNSWIGKRSLGLSHLISKLGHRKGTHWLSTWAVLSGIGFTFIPLHLAAGLSVGYLGHILGDSLSKSGVPLLGPFSKKRYGIPLYKTGGLSETIILLIASTLLTFLLITA